MNAETIVPLKPFTLVEPPIPAELDFLDGARQKLTQDHARLSRMLADAQESQAHYYQRVRELARQVEALTDALNCLPE